MFFFVLVKYKNINYNLKRPYESYFIANYNQSHLSKIIKCMVKFQYFLSYLNLKNL